MGAACSRKSAHDEPTPLDRKPTRAGPSDGGEPVPLMEIVLETTQSGSVESEPSSPGTRGRARSETSGRSRSESLRRLESDDFTGATGADAEEKLDFLLKMLQGQRSDTATAARCLQGLSTLCDSSGVNQTAALMRGALEATVRVMRLHLSEVDVQGSGCAVIASLANQAESHPERFAGAVMLVGQSLRAHPASPEVNHSGRKALQLLSQSGTMRALMAKAAPKPPEPPPASATPEPPRPLTRMPTAPGFAPPPLLPEALVPPPAGGSTPPVITKPPSYGGGGSPTVAVPPPVPGGAVPPPVPGGALPGQPTPCSDDSDSDSDSDNETARSVPAVSLSLSLSSAAGGGGRGPLADIGAELAKGKASLKKAASSPDGGGAAVRGGGGLDAALSELKAGKVKLRSASGARPPPVPKA